MCVHWIFPHQLTDLEKYGGVITFDAVGSLNEHGYPVFTPTCIGGDLKIRPAGYAVVFAESNAACTWVCMNMKKWVPSLVLRVVFIDGLLAESSITSVFPTAAVLLCSWHLICVAIPRNLGRFKDWLLMQKSISRMLYAKSIAALETEWLYFQTTFSLEAVTYMSGIWDMRHRWCAPYVGKHFTAGRNSTSIGESNNGSLKVKWLTAPNQSLLLLLSDTNRRYNEDVRERRTRIAATVISHASLLSGLSGSLGNALQQCKKNHTKPIAHKFGEHLQDLHLYRVSVFTPYTINISYLTHKHIIKVLICV